MLRKATSKLERHCGTSQGCPGVGSGSGRRDESPSNRAASLKGASTEIEGTQDSVDTIDQQCPMILVMDRSDPETRQNHTKNKTRAD